MNTIQWVFDCEIKGEYSETGESLINVYAGDIEHDVKIISVNNKKCQLMFYDGFTTIPIYKNMFTVLD